MQYITSTDLRTKVPEFIETLRRGEPVTLIHRSKVLGKVVLKKEGEKIFDAKKFQKLVDRLNLPSTTDEEREVTYKEHLVKKYGKNLS